MPGNASGGYLIGDTVSLQLIVSVPGTREPVSPASVTLTGITGPAGPVLLFATVFAQTSVGVFVIAVDTTAFVAGVYTWQALLSDGTARKMLVEDTFVLAAPRVTR